MSFNSALFLVFFPIVTFVYFVVPHRFRWAVLLVASAYFYMCFIPVYILILLGMIVVDYIAGIWIEKSSGKKRWYFLLMSIGANLGILIIFKYFNFFNDVVNSLAVSLRIYYPEFHSSLLLPIGLSFHTLQSMSYTIEVYKGNQTAERHVGIFAVYVLFYPQLVAGPIERPGHMLHQFKEEHRFDVARLGSGLRLMVWGFFMKIVVADRLALFVNQVFNNVQYYPGPSIITATILFAFQIYCDFAGYSYIAIGAARTMGFDLVNNFNRPYIARSIQDFWRRWHISLSNWLRDYVYINLGGNQGSAYRTDRNVLITFALSGLWHGAGWTYVLWGLLNGFYLIISRRSQKWRETAVRRWRLNRWPRIYGLGQTLYTFMLVCIGWAVFRAQSLGDARVYFAHVFSGWGFWWHTLHNPEYFHDVALLGQNGFESVVAVLGIMTILGIEWWVAHCHARSKRPFGTWGLYATLALVGIIGLLGQFEAQTFIYFQF